MSINSPRKKIGEILLTHRLITQQQLDQALEAQRNQYEPLGAIMVKMGMVSEENLLQVCAMQKGVSAWHLQQTPPAPEAMRLVPAEVCRNYQILPVAVRSGRLILAMREPDDVDAIDTVRNITRMRVEPVLVAEDRLHDAIESQNYSASHSNSLLNLVSKAMDEADTDTPAESLRAKAISEAEAGPVVGIVNQILTDAVRIKASDIHIEPRREHVEIRYRVDGQLQLAHIIPAQLKAGVAARLKIMADVDVVEYRIPQDGRIRFQVDGRFIDMRVSILPNHHGQRIVLRILDKGVALRKLDELGFSEHNLGLFDEMIRKPFGIVLVTGPTGSGKTTSLYAALNRLKDAATNIMTCEDPIEYELEGVNQSPVNEKVGLTFAAQLRAILRQDPDVILVGEIRDKETAETAIRAALTGHLVLSTLHCNEAAGAVPRLIDMGVEPYLLSTALIGITAQRLLRTLCKDCRRQHLPTSEERILTARYMGNTPTHLWGTSGCPHCANKGYKGRAAVHEVMPVPAEVQQAIAARATVEDLRQIASHYGYRPIQRDACERAAKGDTTIQELRRLVFIETMLSDSIEGENLLAA